ncbi:hypothetical protein BJX70DRAFT_397289 [Aspergillus crustosus]
MDLANLSPSDITFKRRLSGSEDSVRFLVHIQNNPYFLKVHHGKAYWTFNNREKELHDGEVQAYTRMQEHGLSENGIVPRFYGSMKNIDVDPWAPYLDEFWHDEYPPAAFLLELESLMRGIKMIHEVGVEHGKVEPANMMVFTDEADPMKERAVWVDFERAILSEPEMVQECQT